MVIANPSNNRDLVQTLAHNHLSFFDNLSNISEKMSDILAQVCTGTGIITRELYSDDNDFIFNLNGV